MKGHISVTGQIANECQHEGLGVAVEDRMKMLNEGLEEVAIGKEDATEEKHVQVVIPLRLIGGESHIGFLTGHGDVDGLRGKCRMTGNHSKLTEDVIAADGVAEMTSEVTTNKIGGLALKSLL